jgi:hypothetical protein
MSKEHRVWSIGHGVKGISQEENETGFYSMLSALCALRLFGLTGG